MIATILALRDGEPAKFAGPEHDRGVEQTALLEVEHQGGAGLIGHETEVFEPLGIFIVRVPRLPAEIYLDKSHALFH